MDPNSVKRAWANKLIQNATNAFIKEINSTYTTWTVVKNNTDLDVFDFYLLLKQNFDKELNTKDKTVGICNNELMLIDFNREEKFDVLDRDSAITCAKDHLDNVESAFEIVATHEDYKLSRTYCPCQNGQVNWYILSKGSAVNEKI